VHEVLGDCELEVRRSLAFNSCGCCYPPILLARSAW
jgi:hypothetical protein